MLLGVDVGGTFTDAVLIGDGAVHTAKAPTTPHDQSEGVLAAIRDVLARAGAQPGQVREFSHGMTVATNALLEGRGARTALIATEGFSDVIELGRQARASLYRLCESHPAPLVPGDLRLEAPERATPEGILHPLTPDAAAALAAKVAAAGVESVAVALLHSYRHPEHERLLGEALRSAAPAVHVSLSHEVTATVREYERTATTVVDAALSPLLSGYLESLAAAATGDGLPEPSIMQSNGGLTDPATAAAHAALTVLSGPAGGAAGAAVVAARSGFADVVCFDMGGTSCDVCVIEDGQARETAQRMVGGRPVALPMLDLHTVGAGGGSIAWRDPGGALRVGPRSAGAVPGPACYGLGGTEPTVTDANLLLGYLPAGGSLAGGVALDPGRSAAAIDALAGELGLESRRCAEGIVQIADAEMTQALRVMTVERGIDPRGFALLAFGGAGPLHACALAQALGITTVLVPPTAGVLAALGLVSADRRHDVARSVVRRGAALTAEAIAGDVATLAAQARAGLPGEDLVVTPQFDVRYRGQSFELTVAGAPDTTPQQLRHVFEAAHLERFGHCDPDGEIELVTVRVSATEPRIGALPDITPPAAQRGSTRTAWFDGRGHSVTVLRGMPPAGRPLPGPAIVELAEATVLVRPGWAGRVDEHGTLVLEREEQ